MMEITRTEKGTASSKTSGTTLTINNVSMFAGQTMIVGVGYDAGQGAPVVTWGSRTLRQKQTATQAQSGSVSAIFILSNIINSSTRDLTATWAGAITAKAMFAVSIDGANHADGASKNGQTATGSPDTLSTTSTANDTISIAAFVSVGPSSDDPGTVGSGHTSGQRVGTVGAPPISNVTIHETYEILSSIGDIQATKTGATSRDWASVILALRQESGSVAQGITGSDVIAVAEKFESMGKDFSNAAFHYNDELNRWEVFETDITTTLVAHNVNGWA